MRNRLIAALLLCTLAACANKPSSPIAQPSPPESLPLPPMKPPVPAKWAHAVTTSRDSANAVHLSPADFECLAQAIYFEAGNDAPNGQRAVGDVILNRLHDPRFPKTVCDVVHQGGEGAPGHCQFSWWCDGRSDGTVDDIRWQMAQQAANEVVSGDYPDWTMGALFFHSKSVHPYWSRKLQLTNVIGEHIFYR